MHLSQYGLQSETIASCREKEEWHLGHGGSCNTYMGYLSPLLFKAISGWFVALVSKWPVTRKRLAVEQSEIWDSGVGVMWIWGSIELYLFDAMLGISLRTFGALSKWHVTQKCLALEHNVWNLRLGHYSRAYGGTFHFLVLRVSDLGDIRGIVCNSILV